MIGPWLVYRWWPRSAEAKTPDEESKTAEEIIHRIKDPSVLGISTAVSLLVGDHSASEVLSEIEKLQVAKDQLFLLRTWAEHTNKPAEAGAVIEDALRLAIRTTEYVPLATDLRQLATPLPAVTDLSHLRALVGIFDTQKATTEKLGPTEDFVRLQLRLTQSESKYDLNLATRRLLETYYYINDIIDLEVKTTCKARLIAAMPDIDPTFRLSDSRDVLDASLKEFGRVLSGATWGHRGPISRVTEHHTSTRQEEARIGRASH